MLYIITTQMYTKMFYLMYSTKNVNLQTLHDFHDRIPQTTQE